MGRGGLQGLAMGATEERAHGRGPEGPRLTPKEEKLNSDSFQHQEKGVTGSPRRPFPGLSQQTPRGGSPGSLGRLRPPQERHAVSVVGRKFQDGVIRAHVVLCQTPELGRAGVGRHRPCRWVRSGLGESSRGTFHPVGTSRRKVDRSAFESCGQEAGTWDLTRGAGYGDGGPSTHG